MYRQKHVAVGQMPNGEAWKWCTGHRARLDVRWKGRNSTTRIHKLPTKAWPLCRRRAFRSVPGSLDASMTERWPEETS